MPDISWWIRPGGHHVMVYIGPLIRIILARSYTRATENLPKKISAPEQTERFMISSMVNPTSRKIDTVYA